MWVKKEGEWFFFPMWKKQQSKSLMLLTLINISSTFILFYFIPMKETTVAPSFILLATRLAGQSQLSKSKRIAFYFIGVFLPRTYYLMFLLQPSIHCLYHVSVNSSGEAGASHQFVTKTNNHPHWMSLDREETTSPRWNPHRHEETCKLCTV